MIQIESNSVVGTRLNDKNVLLFGIDKLNLRRKETETCNCDFILIEGFLLCACL